MCYAFDFLSPEAPDGNRVGEVLHRFSHAAAEGWACWAFSNHDVERHATRWNMDAPLLRVYLALMLSLRGSACLFQGEELGLHEAYVPYEELQDPYGKRFWPKFRGRDGCRTPMVWLGDHMYGGFTEVKPWLPVAMEHLPMAVSNQSNDPRSMLSFYRRFLGGRREFAPLSKGDFRLCDTAERHVCFQRSHDGQTLFCAFNLSRQDHSIDMPEGRWEILQGTGFEAHLQDGKAYLPGAQALFALRVES
jgi:alpha-glucosidase